MFLVGWFEEFDRQTERAIVEIERNLRAEKARRNTEETFWKKVKTKFKGRKKGNDKANVRR